MWRAHAAARSNGIAGRALSREVSLSGSLGRGAACFELLRRSGGRRRVGLGALPPRAWNAAEMRVLLCSACCILLKMLVAATVRSLIRLAMKRAHLGAGAAITRAAIG